MVCCVRIVVNRPPTSTGEVSRSRNRNRFRASLSFFTRCCSPPLVASHSSSNQTRKEKQKNAPLSLSLSSYFLPCSTRTREARELLRLAGKSRGDQDRKGANFRKWKARIQQRLDCFFFPLEKVSEQVSFFFSRTSHSPTWLFQLTAPPSWCPIYITEKETRPPRNNTNSLSFSIIQRGRRCYKSFFLQGFAADRRCRRRDHHRHHHLLITSSPPADRRDHGHLVARGQDRAPAAVVEVILVKGEDKGAYFWGFVFVVYFF